MPNYKWFRCCGIAAGKVENRNVKVETGRAERVKPRTLCKTKPQRVRHPGASQRVKGRPPAEYCIDRCIYVCYGGLWVSSGTRGKAERISLSTELISTPPRLLSTTHSH